ncbi:MAG: ATP-binding cassette domain-containing protein [Acidimicrobiales bacterium]
MPTAWLLAGGLLLAFMVGPLVALAAELPRIARSDFLDVPGGIRPATGAALWVSLRTATVAVAIVALLGVPLGVWLARTRSRWRHAVTVAVLVPLALPPVVAGLVLLMFVGRAGTLGPLLSHLGISVGETLLGSTLAQMYVAAPFVVIATRAAVADVAPEIEDAARTLGCGPGRALTRVLLPAARRGLVLGLVLGWVRVLGEYGATAIVANYPFTLPVLTYANLQSGGIDPAIPPAVVLGMVATAAAGIVLWLTVDRTPSAPAVAFPVVGYATAFERIGGPRRTATTSGEGLSVDVGLVEGDFGLDVAFEARPGITAILGPSGAGKSLTLKAIAGLLPLERGHVCLGGEHLADVARGIDLPPERRRLGYVSQGDSLFSHMSVAGNVGFGLWRLPRAERKRRVAELLGAFAIGPRMDARTPTLSGGERQRVALARAVAPGPDALLLDEPFGALDAPLRHRARRVVSALSVDHGIPVVLVTHDRDDVEDLADHVVVMGRGRVLQSGLTVEVFSRPASAEVAALVGMANLVTVHGLDARGDGRVNVTTDWGDVSVEAPAGDLTCPGWGLAVPADAVELVAGGNSAGLAVGRVLAVRPRVKGWAIRVEHLGGETLDVMTRIPAPITTGTDCGVRLDGGRSVLVRAAGQPTAPPLRAGHQPGC